VRGFTAIELTMVLLVSGIVAAFAVPIVGDALSSYRLRSAVASATWAIQSTRFQALMEGYPFEVTFQGDANGNNPSYQIASKTVGAASYSNVGSSVPISGSPVNLTAATVVQFQPNGTVTVTQGGTTVSTMQISYQGNSDTITVSNYGNVSVTSP
jgi:prepilin-type N-terminal cleavage/methylation domain-containing protein